MATDTVAYRVGDTDHADPRVLIDPAELAQLREADAALRALEAMQRWGATPPGHDLVGPGIDLPYGPRANLFYMGYVPSGSPYDITEWAATLPDVILAAHAALVAAGELPPLDGGDGEVRG